MTDHPLDDQLLEKFDWYDMIHSQWLFGEEDMRAAYDLCVKAGRDEQMEQVMQWLDKNIANYPYRHYYDTGNYPRPNRRWDKLTAHLKEEMRPINTQETS